MFGENYSGDGSTWIYPESNFQFVQLVGLIVEMLLSNAPWILLFRDFFEC